MSKEAQSSILNNWLSYWRNSLADSESGKGILKRDNLEKHSQFDKLDFIRGKIENDNIVQKLFKKEDNKTQLVKIIVRPVIYHSNTAHEHSKKYFSNVPDRISPIICPIWISRKGWLYPAEKPTIPRDLLTPQSDDRFTLLDVSKLDEFYGKNETILLSEDEVHALIENEDNPEKCFSEWKHYYEISQRLFKELDKIKLDKNYKLPEKDKNYLIKVDDTVNASKNILNLYDWLRDERNTLLLLKNYATKKIKNYDSCIKPSKSISLRLGHSNSKFPLAIEQRDALTQVMRMDDGEILAVNGPPGTGKTTFVLSVVASIWIKAALDDAEPPLIIAASTNNQAVTNIIDAFGKDFEKNDSIFSGRWLPDIKSYGGYFPSSTMEDSVSNLYQTKLFYENLENSKYLDKAELNFLKRANSAFEDEEFKNIESVKKKLLRTIKDYDAKLKLLNTSWSKLEEVKIQCLEKYACSMYESVEKLKLKEKRLSEIEVDRKKWKEYLAHESIWLTLFSWIPLVKSKLLLLRDIFIEDEFSAKSKDIVKSQPKNSELLEQWILEEQKNCSEHAKQNDEWLSIQGVWNELVENFKVVDKNNIDDIDKELDITLRFELFQLTVHYWEIRWLLECRKLQKENQNDSDWAKASKKGDKFLIPRWRRRMMLTPCVVSTLHSLPTHMRYTTSKGKDNFLDEYLINKIDLLIIDEAGQVAPEVAGASFALAKKALVIGDIHQIEPIRSITPSIDIGNLMKNKLLKDKTHYEELHKTGATVTEGSAMKIAQRASHYHYEKKIERGMFLREHHRCYDEIISFCNNLCYKGLLIPKRGNASDTLFPPMAYLHIDGRAEVSETGSCSNLLEAKQIALWLNENRTLIEKKYQSLENNTFEDLVGIVTPFKAQQRLIEKECKKIGIKVNDNPKKKTKGAITIGTVHSLQGAERAIIIFSAVYSRHSDGKFIDMSPSMLNVAVSRAKDSFIVFGDMDVISGATYGKPRNILAQYLFKSASNELVFPLNKRPDLLEICSTPRLITNASEHDRYLKQLLDETVEKIILVSPWISLSKLKETGIYDKMATAVNRGIKVHFYSDKHFNTMTMNQHDEKKYALFQECCEQLELAGITVFVVNGVHSKLVMSDNKYLIVGSYNWGSAARIGRYANMETSMVYAGNLKEEIDLQIEALTSRLTSL